MNMIKRAKTLKLDVKLQLMDKTLVVLHDVIAMNTHQKVNMLVFYLGGSENQEFGIKRFHLHDVHSWQVKVQKD